jgi:hypothetical protein
MKIIALTMIAITAFQFVKARTSRPITAMVFKVSVENPWGNWAGCPGDTAGVLLLVFFINSLYFPAG